MSLLLKIVEGPMKGAEIALVQGTSVTFGRGEECDIVVADQSLAEKAFALEVGEDEVVLTADDGETKTLEPFMVYAFGTTAIAIGPAEGEWEALRFEKKAAEMSEETTASEQPQAEASPAEEGEKPSEDAEASAAEPPVAEPPPVAPPPAAAEPAESGRKTSLLVRLIAVAVSVLLVLAVLLFLFWFFRNNERVAPYYEKACGYCEKARSYFAGGKETASVKQQGEESDAAAVAGPTLAAFAAANGVSPASRGS